MFQEIRLKCSDQLGNFIMRSDQKYDVSLPLKFVQVIKFQSKFHSPPQTTLVSWYRVFMLQRFEKASLTKHVFKNQPNLPGSLASFKIPSFVFSFASGHICEWGTQTRERQCLPHCKKKGSYSAISCCVHSTNSVSDVLAFVGADNRAGLFFVKKSALSSRFLSLAFKD